MTIIIISNPQLFPLSPTTGQYQVPTFSLTRAGNRIDIPNLGLKIYVSKIYSKNSFTLFE